MMAWKLPRHHCYYPFQPSLGMIVLDVNEKPRLISLGYRSVKQTITKHLKSRATSQPAINNFTFHSL